MTVAPFAEITEAQLLPRLVQLEENLYGAVFTLMKLVPARYMLPRAAARGELGAGTVVVETTSGTFGLALAMQAALLRRQLVLVTDPVMDERLRRRVTDLGATVVVCERPAAGGGFHATRLAEVDRVMREIPDSYCPRQYDNPASYRVVAEHIHRVTGRVDCLVGPVGSGGSMCGTASVLRERHGGLHAIGVDTPGSVLFGQPDMHRSLRGLGNSLLPGNLDQSMFDDVHWCAPAPAHSATRELHRNHAMFQGPTSGAAYLVARWYARRHPDQRCVVMLPDEGHRYDTTVYDDVWLAANGGAPVARVQDLLQRQTRLLARVPNVSSNTSAEATPRSCVFSRSAASRTKAMASV